MIELWLAAAAASAAAIPSAPASAPELLADAEYAVRANRLDQASLMVARAMQAGAGGRELNRVLADLAYASGKYPEALARYDELLRLAPSDSSLLEAAGISALKLGEADRAASLLSRAVSASGASWRAWSALGAAADLRSDWATADQCYDRAERLAPDEAGPINNRGWSLLLRGNWTEAVGLFEKAAAMDPKSLRAANNLELAKAALAAKLPSRRAAESDASWAARLNDAGVAAAILGDRTRAASAFTQAMGVSGAWYARAADNLEALGSR